MSGLITTSVMPFRPTALLQMPFRPEITIVTTLDASDTAWTPAAHRLFTVTGVIRARLFGRVTETLTEDNGDETIEVGIAGDTAALIDQLAAPLTLAAGDTWIGSTGSTAIPSGFFDDGGWFIIAATDIDLTVAGSTGINDGTIDFYLEWVPMSVGAVAVAAVWD